MANGYLANMMGKRVKKQSKDSGDNSGFLDDLEEMLEGKNDVDDTPEEEVLNSIDEEPEEESKEESEEESEEVVVAYTDEGSPVNENQGTNNHEIRVMWIIDGTVSFTTVFPAIYYRIEAIIKALEERKRMKNQQGIKITHGLTVMNEKSVCFEFPDGSSFTESRDKFMGAMRKIKFQGGNADGRENFVGAISTALKVLNDDNSENVSHGLFVFSDSLPKEEELRFNFGAMRKHYTERGIRFAHIYCYDGERYAPILKPENRGENGRNYTNVYTLTEFLELEESEALGVVNKLAEELFNDCSV